MKTGMLWFDNDPRADLNTKIARAAEYYQKKYGANPNLCFVHPTMAKSGAFRTGAIEVRLSRQVLPNHLWIGANDLSVGG
jgi:hypothetical protein